MPDEGHHVIVVGDVETAIVRVAADRVDPRKPRRRGTELLGGPGRGRGVRRSRRLRRLSRRRDRRGRFHLRRGAPRRSDGSARRPIDRIHGRARLRLDSDDGVAQRVQLGARKRGGSCRW